MRACVQKRAFDMDAVDVLGALLTEDVSPSLQASSVWAISSICTGFVKIQDSIRTKYEGVVLSRVVGLLDSAATQVFF